MPPIEELLAEVDAWFAEELQRAPISYHTEIYNQVHVAWQSLRNRLSVAVTGQPLTPPAPSEDEAGGEAGTGAPEDAEVTEEPSEDSQMVAEAPKSSKSTKTGI